MKQVLVAGFFASVFYGGLQFFKSPEKYLLKKTKHLIQLASQTDAKLSLSLARRVSEINKYIHHDLRLKAEYEGRIYQARSLNEFRSLLTAYFQAGATKKLEYENLKAELKEEKRGEVSFSILFHNISHASHCDLLLIWIKEKKWLIKNINIENCKKESG